VGITELSIISDLEAKVSIQRSKNGRVNRYKTNCSLLLKRLREKDAMGGE